MGLDSFPFAPFDGAGVGPVVFIYLSVFFGFFVRGAFGFGSNMPIVLLLTWVLGPHHTIFVVAVMAILCQVHLLPQGPRDADWKVVVSILPGMIVGIVLSTFALDLIEGDSLTTIMGILVLGVVVMDRLDVITRLSAGVDLRAFPVSFGLSSTSGALGTLSGGGGLYFLAGYLKHACPRPAVFRGTNIVVAGSFMFVRFATLASVGLISFEYLMEAVLLLPAILGGTWAGSRFFRASDAAVFYRALQWLMLLAAVALIAKGLATWASG